MARQAERDLPNFRELTGFTGQMCKLINHDTRTLNAKFDGRDVILDPNEYTILPLEVARHLRDTFNQGAQPFDLEMKSVEAVYRDADEMLRDEELGIEAKSLPELLRRVKEAAVAGFKRTQQAVKGNSATEETDSEHSARVASHPNSVATDGIAKGDPQTPGGGQPTPDAEANKGPDGGISAHQPEALAQGDDAVANAARRRR